MEHTEHPPISTTLRISQPTCSISGVPPFTVFSTHTCTSKEAIWVLAKLYVEFLTGFKVVDPKRNHHRVGPSGTRIVEIDDDYIYDLEDTELVRLGVGQNFIWKYNFTAERKEHDMVPSDMSKLVVGEIYNMALQERRWRWMFEREMPHGIRYSARRQLLEKKRPAKWNVDSMIEFTPVE